MLAAQSLIKLPGMEGAPAPSTSNDTKKKEEVNTDPDFDPWKQDAENQKA